MNERMRAAGEKWERYRLGKGQAVLLAAAAVALTLIAGFGGAGWMTAATAQQRIDEATQIARNELAAAVCVEEFMAHADAKAGLAKLRSAGYWDRSDVVASGGFATMPDRKEPNTTVAIMCAARLSEIES
jgi:hypothetical protein